MVRNLQLLETKGAYNLYVAPTHLHQTDDEGKLTDKPLYGWGCGYVGIPSDHPYYGLSIDDLPFIDVHGCVTYSESQGDEWLIGFDCHHGLDTIEKCSEEYVKQNVYKLYESLYTPEQDNVVEGEVTD